MLPGLRNRLGSDAPPKAKSRACPTPTVGAGHAQRSASMAGYQGWSPWLVRVLAVMAACGAVIVPGQTRTAAGPYTAQQAADGRSAYQAHCASCHLPDLGGRNEAPRLAGPNFMNAWGARTTSDLFTYIQSTMPPGMGGSLGRETYLDLVAFLLEANGAGPGNQPLTPETGTLISSVSTGQMPAYLRRAIDLRASGPK